jgi:hypothetical protein
MDILVIDLQGEFGRDRFAAGDHRIDFSIRRLLIGLRHCCEMITLSSAALTTLCTRMSMCSMCERDEARGNVAAQQRPDRQRRRWQGRAARRKKARGGSLKVRTYL